MKNIPKKKIAIAVAVVAVIGVIVGIILTQGMKKEDFGKWYNEEFSPAYDAFVQTETDKEVVPAIDVSSIIVSDQYLKDVFNYITEEKQPEAGEITEENGVYTYTNKSFRQEIEFDEKTTSIRINHFIGVAGYERLHITATLTERNDMYYIQYLFPDLSTYYELCFTAEGGEIKRETRSEIPYSIFAEEIPDTFAKEN